MRAFMRAQTAVFKTSIPFFGLGGTVHEKVCKELGVPFVPEVFCDIDYTSGGTLLGVPQSNPATPESAAGKIRQMLTSQESTSRFDRVGPADAQLSTLTAMHCPCPSLRANSPSACIRT